MKLLLISGSTRAASSNTAALRTVQALAPDGSASHLYDGLSLLPAFNPDDDSDPLPAPVVDLRARISAADAVLFCVPEYAGTLPGSLKNLLDWTVRGGEIYEKPVGWLNVANPGRGAGAAAHLELVLGYVGAIAVPGACLRVPLVGAVSDGLAVDEEIRTQLAGAWTGFARAAAAADRPAAAE